jgi:uncharacterized Zn finger protein
MNDNQVGAGHESLFFKIAIAMDLLQIKRLCNDRSLARGETYFNEGRVRNLSTGVR